MHCDVFAGFIFVNFAQQPSQSLRDYLGPLLLGIEDYPFHEMTERYDFRVECRANWKVFSDAFMNLPRSLGLVTTLMRTAGGPKCPPLFRIALVKDRRAVRASLERLADTSGLTRLVPSHGDIYEGDAAATLRQVVARDLR